MVYPWFIPGLEQSYLWIIPHINALNHFLINASILGIPRSFIPAHMLLTKLSAIVH